MEQAVIRLQQAVVLKNFKTAKVTVLPHCIIFFKFITFWKTHLIEKALKKIKMSYLQVYENEINL